ncbi:MAG: hypothetical protein IJE78_05980 [Bacteroidaceae bacterium]|nr:hypothetical protein [Bacteroidaceae bacterium]
MTHIPVYNKDYVQKLFEELAKDPYSYLWQVVGDFEINGHEVMITSSSQFKQVIIDNVYVRVGVPGEGCVITTDGRKLTNLEYTMYRLGFDITQ